MKCPIQYSTQEILSHSQKGGIELDLLIDHLIEVLCQCRSFIGTVFKYIKNNGGNQQDGEDIIQDGLAQLAVNLIEGKFLGNSSVENYALGICKNKWHNKKNLHSRTKVGVLDEAVQKQQIAPENTEANFLQSEQQSILWSIVQKMTGKCPKFLEYWALGYSHKEVAEKMGVSERRSLNAVSECRKKLRDWIRAHPQFERLLRDI